MKTSEEVRLKARVKKLRGVVKKHRAIFYKAAEDAARLEKPLIMKEIKERFEGKYFQNVDARSEEYIYCEKITGYEKISGGEITPTGVFVFISKNKKNPVDVSISRRTMDYAGAYCKNPMPKSVYASRVNAILKDLNLHGE